MATALRAYEKKRGAKKRIRISQPKEQTVKLKPLVKGQDVSLVCLVGGRVGLVGVRTLLKV